MRPAPVVAAVLLGAAAMPLAVEPPVVLPAAGGCRVEVGKVAVPSAVVLGQETAITLTVRAECSPLQVPLHVALVFDNSIDMGGRRMNDMRSAVAAFVDELDFSVSRVGLAGYSGYVEILSELTDDRDAVVEASERFYPRAGSDLTKAVRAGRVMLHRGRALAVGQEFLEVMVLLAGSPSDSGDEELMAEARLARDEGIIVVAIAGRGTAELEVLEAIATSASFFHIEGTGSRYPALFRQIVGDLTNVQVTGAQVVDTLPGNMTYVWGSGIPAPRTRGQDLVWRYDRWPAQGITITYAVAPQAVGCHPTNVAARVELRFDRGDAEDRALPVPTVCIVPPPTETPAPTATTTPTLTPWPTPTTPPTPTPEPYRLYLPVALGGHYQAVGS